MHLSLPEKWASLQSSKPVEVKKRWKDVWISVKEQLRSNLSNKIGFKTKPGNPGTKPSQSFRISFIDLARTILQRCDLWKRLSLCAAPDFHIWSYGCYFGDTFSQQNGTFWQSNLAPTTSPCFSSNVILYIQTLYCHLSTKGTACCCRHAAC